MCTYIYSKCLKKESVHTLGVWRMAAVQSWPNSIQLYGIFLGLQGSLSVCKAVLCICGSVLSVCKALLSVRRALLIVCRALWCIGRARLSV